jgi:hypothetical protein
MNWRTNIIALRDTIRCILRWQNDLVVSSGRLTRSCSMHLATRSHG